MFAAFAHTNGFHHVTSSPKYAQSNGEAERAIKTVKGLLKKTADPYLALLVYKTLRCKMATARLNFSWEEGFAPWFQHFQPC